MAIQKSSRRLATSATCSNRAASTNDCSRIFSVLAPRPPVRSASEPTRGESLSRAAGADHYVRKPYDQDALLSLLSGLGEGGKT